MKMRLTVALVAAILLVAPSSRAQEDVEQLVREFIGEVAAPQRSAQELRVAYGDVLTALLPDMGADNLERRAAAQGVFERICFRASRPGAEVERATLCEVMLGALGPQTALPARVWLLRQLERMSSDESVEALGKLLNDTEPRVRELARRALQKSSSENATMALAAGLTVTQEPAWQVALLNALGARGDGSIVPQIARLAHEGHPDVAAAAIAALADIANLPAIDALRNIYGTANPARQALAEAGLLRVADQLAAQGAWERAAPLYTELAATPVAPPTKLAALRGLAIVTPEQALVELLTVVRSDAPLTMRLDALRLATELPQDAAVQQVIALLPDLPVELQVVALDALAQRGDPAALPAVIRALDAADETVRVAALEALRVLGNRDFVLVLANRAAQTSGAERNAARDSLARMAGDSIDEQIITDLDGAGPTLRAELIRALRARWDYAAVPVLLREARNEDASVRIAALEALGALSRPADAPALVGLLIAAEPENVQEAAIEAVVAVCSQNKHAELRAAPVLAAWDAADDAARVRLVQVLGRLHGTAALERIRAARQSTDADLVDAAIRALANWPDASVLVDLSDIAQHAESRTQRVLALRGYIRLLSLPSDRVARETVAMYETALSLAERPDEQKLVLAGLATIPDVEALALAQRCLASDVLRAEAEAAVVADARLIGPLHPEEARAALDDVLNGTKIDAMREAAKAASEHIRGSQGCVIDWVYAGPYFEDGLDWQGVYAKEFPPEDPRRISLEWHALPITTPDQPWVFDLTKVDNGSNRCLYVRTRVWSEPTQDALLTVGSDDAVKVWVNDKLVHEYDQVRAHTPLEDRVLVKLNAGWNTIQLKIVQGTGGWGFSCALRTPGNDPLEGLRFKAP